MRAGDGNPRRADDLREPYPGWTPTRADVTVPPWSAPPVSAPPPTPPAPPPTPTPPRRPGPASRTWWIAPFLGGALAVLLVTAVVQLTVLRHPAGKASAAGSTTPGASQAAQAPAQAFPDALFGTLTRDVQQHNEAGLLGLVAPGARPAVRVWWENMQAIGYTTGLIMPTASDDRVNLNSHGYGTATVMAGTHNPLDPVGSNGKPDIPLERYQVGLHFASAKATGQITSWKPLGDDPWDQGGKLYVRKAANVVVAGPAADSGVVDETLPVAQAAASYDVGLVNHVNANDLHQQGFVVFVSGNSATRGAWFTAGPQPAGWPPAFFGGLTAPLPGPGVSADTGFSVGDVSDGTTGGARVVIAPFEDQNGGTQHQETVELVHQFMLDILAADDQALAGGLAPATVPAWSLDGLAVAVQALYEGNTNPAPGTYDFTPLDNGLKALPASYRDGHLPTPQQLFTGSMATEENWNDVAASVYEYIAVKHGMNQMFAAAGLLWTRYATPFGNVLSSSGGGNFNFFTANTIESGWKAALAKI